MSSMAILFGRLTALTMALYLVVSLFATSGVASPIPNDEKPQAPLDLGFKPAPDPKDHPIPGLPVKLYVHAGPKCHSERTHLYYLPENVCIGPLYHPAGSIKLLSRLPEGCFIKGFTDGHCKDDEVKINGANRLTGPKEKDVCVGLHSDSKHTSSEEEAWGGVNSLVVDCGRFGQ